LQFGAAFWDTFQECSAKPFSTISATLETPASFRRHRHHRGKNPVCGDILKLSARIADGRIAEARFSLPRLHHFHCCASMLTEKLIDCAIADARIITADSLSESLGGLPAATFHGAQLAADAVTALLQKIGSAGR